MKRRGGADNNPLVDQRIIEIAANVDAPMGDYQITQRIQDVLREMNVQVNQVEKNRLFELFIEHMPLGMYALLQRQGGRNKTRRGRKSQRKTRAKRRV